MSINKQILLCTDMDRTVIPNGPQEESSAARAAFRHLVQTANLSLAYVSGRDLGRVLAAIDAYHLPLPNFIIADVGTSLYKNDGCGWIPVGLWHEELSQDWCGLNVTKIQKKIHSLEFATLQENDKQGVFKLSYSVNPSQKMVIDLATLEQCLSSFTIDEGRNKRNLKFKIVHSIDETNNEGLIDILPASAGKLGAINFLSKYLDLDEERIVFCGDSGNDLEVILSQYKSTIVKNATQEFKDQVTKLATKAEKSKTIYFADGEMFKFLNGNYSAGVIEGAANYFPELKHLITGNNYEN